MVPVYLMRPRSMMVTGEVRDAGQPHESLAEVGQPRCGMPSDVACDALERGFEVQQTEQALGANQRDVLLETDLQPTSEPDCEPAFNQPLSDGRFGSEIVVEGIPFLSVRTPALGQKRTLFFALSIWAA